MAITYYGAGASFRILGTAATPHTLFTIENTAGSAVPVRIKRLICQLDATAVLVSVMPLVKTSRCAAIPTGGTVLAKGNFNTLLASAANVILRGANASDGGVASAITATAGDIIWQQYCMRMHTAVGQVLSIDNNCIPNICDTTPVILAANQALMVQVVASAGASNPATNHWFVQCMWEEGTP
jgi:hypothetical protein